MNINNFKLLIISIIIVVSTIILHPIITQQDKIDGEIFYSLATLGAEGKAQSYFPNNDINIALEENIYWYLYIYNHVGKTSYISLRLKVLNSTMEPPNSTLCRPSPYPTVYEINRIIMDNETLILPLNWSINEINFKDNKTSIELITINDDLMPVYVIAKDRTSFRMIIELWIFDDQNKDFFFKWNSYNNDFCAWNQIWFNVTSN